eukprot:5525952-Alexandrium_andersonii.AAC.1
MARPIVMSAHRTGLQMAAVAPLALALARAPGPRADAVASVAVLICCLSPAPGCTRALAVGRGLCSRGPVPRRLAPWASRRHGRVRSTHQAALGPRPAFYRGRPLAPRLGYARR